MNWQFSNLYGHPSARLICSHSYQVEVPIAPTKEESITMEDLKMGFRDRFVTYYQTTVAFILRIVCALLFDAPIAHNDALEKIWVDKIVNKVLFQHLIDRTVKDWGDASLFSTVLWTYVKTFSQMIFICLNFV